MTAAVKVDARTGVRPAATPLCTTERHRAEELLGRALRHRALLDQAARDEALGHELLVHGCNARAAEAFDEARIARLAALAMEVSA